MESWSGRSWSCGSWFHGGWSCGSWFHGSWSHGHESLYVVDKILLQQWNTERRAASYTEPRHHIPNAFRCSKFQPCWSSSVLEGHSHLLASHIRSGKLDLLFHISARFLWDRRLICHHRLPSNDTPSFNGHSAVDLPSIYRLLVCLALLESSILCVENLKPTVCELAMQKFSNVHCSLKHYMVWVTMVMRAGEDSILDRGLGMRLWEGGAHWFKWWLEL